MQLLDRKRFVNTLGVAGLSLGLLVTPGGAPLAIAQEQASQPPGIDLQLFQYEEGSLDLIDEELKQLLIQLLQERAQEKEGALAFQNDERSRDDANVRMHGGAPGEDNALRVEVYNEFTQALADELGIDDADEIDAAIRNAMMAGVDANDGLTKEGAQELKELIINADAPVGPTIRGWGG